MNSDKVLATVCVPVNKSNGGESITLVARLYDNGDHTPEGIYPIFEVSLQSYCNCATLHLSDLNVDLLRKFANLYDATLELAKQQMLAETKKNNNEQ